MPKLFQYDGKEWIEISKNGLAGKDGYTPIKGVDYFDGAKGADGANGLSAYEVWLKNGNTGTEEDYLQSLKGQNGIDGKTIETVVISTDRSRKALASKTISVLDPAVTPTAGVEKFFARGDHTHDISLIGGSTDHATLSNLDYASSGHTGFQASGTYLTYETKHIMTRLASADTAIGTISSFGGAIECPYTGTITGCGAYVDTAGGTEVLKIDLLVDGTTILGTDKICIGSGQRSSRDYGTAPNITGTAASIGDFITFDVTQVSSGTAQKGLTTWLSFRI